MTIDTNKIGPDVRGRQDPAQGVRCRDRVHRCGNWCAQGSISSLDLLFRDVFFHEGVEGCFGGVK